MGTAYWERGGEGEITASYATRMREQGGGKRWSADRGARGIVLLTEGTAMMVCLFQPVQMVRVEYEFFLYALGMCGVTGPIEHEH